MYITQTDLLEQMDSEVQQDEDRYQSDVDDFALASRYEDSSSEDIDHDLGVRQNASMIICLCDYSTLMTTHPAPRIRQHNNSLRWRPKCTFVDFSSASTSQLSHITIPVCSLTSFDHRSHYSQTSHLMPSGDAFLTSSQLL
jgi:hypothetical protein